MSTVLDTWLISRELWWQPGSRKRWKSREWWEGRTAGTETPPDPSTALRHRRCPLSIWKPRLMMSYSSWCKQCCTHPGNKIGLKTILSNALPPTVLKITGIERIQARNQRKKTATRHLDLERNPTSLNGCTTTMYLVQSWRITKFSKSVLESARQAWLD